MIMPCYHAGIVGFGLTPARGKSSEKPSEKISDGFSYTVKLRLPKKTDLLSQSAGINDSQL